ncbi:MAG TPA: hypothetical protein VK983_03605 [Candidatus Limnocylindrales bacterium]|nr:hypothetical protein [Candidatus Limnocylindrales bacterium]
MAATKSRANFLSTPDGVRISDLLDKMVADVKYNTQATYSVTGAGNLKSFTTKHVQYLIANPGLDPDMYLANLRMMTRVR